MPKVKQIIVVRKDLNMRKGKMAVQVSHASLAFIQKRLHKTGAPDKFGQFYETWLSNEEIEWFQTGTTKIVCQIDSLSELIELGRKANALKIEYNLITDAGYTEFKEPTVTCACFGPDRSEALDSLCGALKLF